MRVSAAFVADVDRWLGVQGGNTFASSSPSLQLYVQIYSLNVALLIMLLSHPENIYRLFVRCGIAYIRLMLLFAAITF